MKLLLTVRYRNIYKKELEVIIDRWRDMGEANGHLYDINSKIANRAACNVFLECAEDLEEFRNSWFGFK